MHKVYFTGPRYFKSDDPERFGNEDPLTYFERMLGTKLSYWGGATEQGERRDVYSVEVAEEDEEEGLSLSQLCRIADQEKWTVYGEHQPLRMRE